MLKAFFRSWLGWLMLAPRLARSVSAAGAGPAFKRAVVFALGWLLFGVLNALHWFGFLLDEVLFRRYRKVNIHRPLAIVGIPRSGTTFLQRALAAEPRFTTLTLFECVLAPSVAERYVWFGIARLFTRFKPKRLPGVGAWLARMEDIHPLGLGEPEEDFLLLMWIHACFLAVLLCPEDEKFWRLARFDRAVPEAERRTIMTFYYRCLQKHLYYHGEDRRLLSKNPSLTPMLASLRETCPDAIVVGCVREPHKTVPSQLSSLLPAFELLGDGTMPPQFQARMIDLLRGYYEDLAQFAREDSILLVEMARLNNDLEAVIDEILELAGHAPSPEFVSQLSLLGSGGRSYRSAHRYSLETFELTEEEIHRSFSEVWPLSLKSA